ncbi:MAG TPA: orotidine 5'-phosphate decarboxylase / HUMPS family protein, partial [Candidatus Udaeobacter sp.]|nr:orotidine 5'-phosphate decarboxylase / HUMPS family protein [Candidatus Udaeobacter sp.]
MASNLELLRSHGSMRERLIVALDVGDLEEAKKLVKVLTSEIGMFKVGKQLFTHAGPQAVRLIQELGGE